jgi:hypothetical protein
LSNNHFDNESAGVHVCIDASLHSAGLFKVGDRYVAMHLCYPGGADDYGYWSLLSIRLWSFNNRSASAMRNIPAVIFNDVLYRLSYVDDYTVDLFIDRNLNRNANDNLD